jgi:hypothetical protein
MKCRAGALATYYTLREVDQKTIDLSIRSHEHLSPTFCAALGEFRDALLDELNRTGKPVYGSILRRLHEEVHGWKS